MFLCLAGKASQVAPCEAAAEKGGVKKCTLFISPSVLDLLVLNASLLIIKAHASKTSRICWREEQGTGTLITDAADRQKGTKGWEMHSDCVTHPGNYPPLQTGCVYVCASSSTVTKPHYAGSYLNISILFFFQHKSYIYTYKEQCKSLEPINSSYFASKKQDFLVCFNPWTWPVSEECFFCLLRH